MGPQHPSTHGVLQVKLKLDGERVIDAECVIGYLHRGVEKLGEAQTYGQFVPTLDRMDYIAAVSNCLGYCEAIEKLLGVTAPPRAQYIRVLMTELNRITSHLLWLGTHAIDLGAVTVFLYCFREREEILKIFENYCGARPTTHMFRIGGTQYEIYEGFQDQVRAFVKDQSASLASNLRQRFTERLGFAGQKTQVHIAIGWQTGSNQCRDHR